jgi:hypothetical protein
VHPYRADEHELVLQSEPVGLRQPGQRIVDPTNARIGVPFARRPAHAVRRLDCDDLMASVGEPGRVAAGPRADIEHSSWRCRQQIQNRAMRVLECETLIHLRELGGVGVVRSD